MYNSISCWHTYPVNEGPPVLPHYSVLHLKCLWLEVVLYNKHINVH